MSLEILPRTPTSQQELRLVLSGGAREGRISWELNGEPLGLEGDLLPPGIGSKGDEITAVLDHAEGRVSRSVILANTAPQVVSVGLDDPFIRRGKDIVLLPEIHDPDGDEVSLSFRWVINGREVPEVDGPVLEGDRFRKGDRIEVSIEPHDGEAAGPVFRGGALVVPNAPPAITGAPPAVFSEAGYLYRVSAEDPDGDELHYFLEGPEGMGFEAGGNLVWREAARFPGVHRVRIAVRDQEGAGAVQEYTLYVVE